MRLVNWLSTLLQDVRYGIRSLKRNPLLSGAIVLTLSLGIGLNIGVFTLINAMLFRASVDKDPDTFIRIYAEYSDRFVQGAVNLADYRAYQSGTHSLRDLAAWDDVWTKLGGTEPLTIRVLFASCNFFSVYGLERAKLGRLFLANDCVNLNSAPVAVLSEEIWRERFQADPRILGSVIRLGSHSFTVVGVTPARFSGRVKNARIWIPHTMQSQFSGWPWFTIEGRLRRGYTRAAAQAELNVLARQQDRLQPGRRTTLIVTNGSLIAEPHLRVAIWVVSSVMGALTLLLLIACINVTTLLLSRAVSRQREIAVRLSLGAGRTRLLRMLLTETLILAVAAGAISLYLAFEVPQVLMKLALTDPPVYSLKPDLVVLAYLAGITLVAGFVAGAAPAAQSLKVDLLASLKGHGGLFGSGINQGRTLELLVGSQLAMSLVLLAAAGICVRAQYTMFTADPGFEMKQVIAVPLDISVPPHTADSARSFYRTLEHRVRTLPGVQSVCYASTPPFERLDMADIRLPGQSTGMGRLVSVNFVSANYFETLGIPIIRGLAFQDQGSTPARSASEVIVSQAFARAFWPVDDPLGKVIELTNSEHVQVIGVARDTRSQRYGELDGPQLYRLQSAQTFGGPLMVRFEGRSQPLEREIREVISSMDPGQIAAPVTLEKAMDDMADKFWRLAQMVLFLGLVAVVLAVVGIYGVVSFGVSRRTREFGIRAALGATKADIIRFVFRSGIKSIAGGLCAGLVITVGISQVLARLMRNAPFALDTMDPQVYVAVSALLILAAFTAMFRPALRAAGSDPSSALRQD